MIDLGDSINLMPYATYKLLNLGPLQPTGVVIQLADRSFTYPDGVVEDVLVRVGSLIFPVDFYIVNMDDSPSYHAPHMLLGRPFMKTAKTKIDVDQGTLSFEFDGEILTYDVFDAMKHPSDVESVFYVS
ncbi:UNVERIFIED_CONTAM: retroviral-like aspartic protease, partial [Salmonella enterica subsp. enterica serovar Weltevreden]